MVRAWYTRRPPSASARPAFRAWYHHVCRFDGTGRLSSVTDALNHRLTVERDGDGIPLAIVAPYGQRTPIAAGMRTLRDDGCRLVAEGITTPDEVLRVTAG